MLPRTAPAMTRLSTESDLLTTRLLEAGSILHRD